MDFTIPSTLIFQREDGILIHTISLYKTHNKKHNNELIVYTDVRKVNICMIERKWTMSKQGGINPRPLPPKQ
ncbi:hypothetical protein CYJ33_02430 [Alloscardovia omnicolens]|nr:hypothetical protein CYJ33_02430 [Alloscardovia omnicolens]